MLYMKATSRPTEHKVSAKRGSLSKPCVAQDDTGINTQVIVEHAKQCTTIDILLVDRVTQREACEAHAHREADNNTHG